MKDFIKLKYSIPLAIGLVITWLVTTVFIDFVAVPAVFTTVTSRDDAASLGIKIFTKYNFIEIGVCLALIILSRYRTRKFFILMLAIPLFYSFHLSPSIDKYNNLKANLIDEDPKMESVQRELDYYHNFYVRLDSVKILLLILIFGTQIKHLNKIQIREE